MLDSSQLPQPLDSIIIVEVLYILSSFLLTVLHGLWDFSSSTRDWIQAIVSESRQP